jgi:hypothetical protein
MDCPEIKVARRDILAGWFGTRTHCVAPFLVSARFRSA